MKKGKFCIMLGLLFIIAALGFLGYNLIESIRAEESVKSVLPALQKTIAQATQERQEQLDDTDGKEQSEILLPNYLYDPYREMPTQEIDGESYIGTIEIPVLGFELPIISEWNYARLKKAPCRYTGTAYANNLVLCAHNFRRHFGKIHTLKAGDIAIITDVEGNVFYYEVTETETLPPTAVEEMTFSDADLTLFTCTIGGRTRVTVRFQKM